MTYSPQGASERVQRKSGFAVGTSGRFFYVRSNFRRSIPHGPQRRRIRVTSVTKNAVDQPIRMSPLMPSIADTRRHCSAIAASL